MSNVADNLSLVILAGGRGSRLGGVDKSRIMIDGTSQLDRWLDVFATQVTEIFVCNRTGQAVKGAQALPDDPHWPAHSGPIAGLAAAVAKTARDWLFTLPVDTVSLPPNLLREMKTSITPGLDGIRLVDQDGPQALVALWRVIPLRERLHMAQTRDERAIWKLQRERYAEVHHPHFRCGNLNTPQDLKAFHATEPDERR